MFRVNPKKEVGYRALKVWSYKDMGYGDRE
jgi:hypothetical protein